MATSLQQTRPPFFSFSFHHVMFSCFCKWGQHHPAGRAGRDWWISQIRLEAKEHTCNTLVFLCTFPHSAFKPCPRLQSCLSMVVPPPTELHLLFWFGFGATMPQNASWHTTHLSAQYAPELFHRIRVLFSCLVLLHQPPVMEAYTTCNPPTIHGCHFIQIKQHVFFHMCTSSVCVNT